MKWQVVVVFAALVGFVLGACGQNTASREVALDDVLFTVSFDEPGSWEEGDYAAAPGELPASTLVISEGRYQIDHRSGRSSSFIWGAGGPAQDNVIIEVDTEQLSAFNDNLYGVGCRLVTDDRGNASGYVLLVSGDGHYGIAELENRSLNFILEWHQAGKTFKTGRSANTLRAVCLGDYLALYANGEFLGEVTSPTYRRAGQVGLVAGASSEGEIKVAFDNLTAYAGELREK